jgi:hypothetical protein
VAAVAEEHHHGQAGQLRRVAHRRSGGPQAAEALAQLAQRVPGFAALQVERGFLQAQRGVLGGQAHHLVPVLQGAVQQAALPVEARQVEIDHQAVGALPPQRGKQRFGFLVAPAPVQADAQSEAGVLVAGGQPRVFRIQGQRLLEQTHRQGGPSGLQHGHGQQPQRRGEAGLELHRALQVACGQLRQPEGQAGASGEEMARGRAGIGVEEQLQHLRRACVVAQRVVAASQQQQGIRKPVGADQQLLQQGYRARVVAAPPGLQGLLVDMIHEAR